MTQGVRLHAERCCEAIPAGVDTAEDLEVVRQLLSKR
jgi:CMP-2-keto-3-deoxyoctulosonic acid synthetase